jgi:hypothetical protein
MTGALYIQVKSSPLGDRLSDHPPYGMLALSKGGKVMIYSSPGNLFLDARRHWKEPFSSIPCIHLLHASMSYTGSWSGTFQDAWAGSTDALTDLQSALERQPDGVPLKMHLYEYNEQPEPHDRYFVGPGRLTTLSIGRSPEGNPFVELTAEGSLGLECQVQTVLTLKSLAASVTPIRALLRTLRQRSTVDPAVIERMTNIVQHADRLIESTNPVTPEEIRVVMEQIMTYNQTS